MNKHFSISKTTKIERQRLVDEALAMTTLDAPEPTPETKKLLEKFVAGEMKLSEVLRLTIERYKKN